MLHVQKFAGGLETSPEVSWGLTGRNWNWGTPKRRHRFWKQGWDPHLQGVSENVLLYL